MPIRRDPVYPNPAHDFGSCLYCYSLEPLPESPQTRQSRHRSLKAGINFEVIYHLPTLNLDPEVLSMLLKL